MNPRPTRYERVELPDCYHPAMERTVCWHCRKNLCDAVFKERRDRRGLDEPNISQGFDGRKRKMKNNHLFSMAYKEGRTPPTASENAAKIRSMRAVCASRLTGRGITHSWSCLGWSPGGWKRKRPGPLPLLEGVPAFSAGKLGLVTLASPHPRAWSHYRPS